MRGHPEHLWMAFIRVMDSRLGRHIAANLIAFYINLPSAGNDISYAVLSTVLLTITGLIFSQTTWLHVCILYDLSTLRWYR